MEYTTINASTGIELTIVIPAYNEENRFPAMLSRLLEGFSNGLFDYLSTQVLVVDDGSRDNTANIARSYLRDLPWANIIRLPANRGKGAAVRSGVIRARGKRLVFIDADMAIDPLAIPELVSKLDHCDIAIASRAHPQSKNIGPLVSRTIAGRAFNALVRRITGMNFLDTQCGFKAFNTKVAKILFYLSTVDHFSFDVEILWIAKELGMTIEEAPVTWRHVNGSHINAITDPLSMLIDVYRTTSQPPQLRGLPIISVHRSKNQNVSEKGNKLPELSPKVRGNQNDDQDSADTVMLQDSISRAIRVADLTVPYEDGVAVIMPLSSASERKAMTTSLTDRIPGITCSESWATIGTLLDKGLRWKNPPSNYNITPDKNEMGNGSSRISNGNNEVDKGTTRTDISNIDISDIEVGKDAEVNESVTKDSLQPNKTDLKTETTDLPYSINDHRQQTAPE